MRTDLDWMVQLERQLERLVSGLNSPAEGVPEARQLAASVRAVKSRFGAGVSSRTTGDRVNRLVDQLRRDPSRSLTRGDRFVLAHSLSSPLAVLNQRPIIETNDLASVLLNDWEAAAERGTIRASHWRGLFHSYLQSNRGPNTERLRRLLQSTASGILSEESVLRPWAAGLRRHRQILDAKPCERYVAELLDGDAGLLEDLLDTVSVPDASWFWQEMTMTATSAIERWAAPQLIERIPTLLDLATRIFGGRDPILVATLDRYARFDSAGCRLDLLTYALEAWQSPQLARNALWSQVSEEARRMVCGWLALEDLEDFYQLCQDSRQIDQRRLQFWLRFKGQMDYTQIVMGQALQWSRDPDIRAFRERKKGRFALLSGGSASNNAIVMQIGEWVFVEFSQTGNACFVYRSSVAPFKLGESRYSLTDLKAVLPDSDDFGRLIHRANWERDTFLPFLRSRRLVPDSESSRAAIWQVPEGASPTELSSPLSAALEVQLRSAGARLADHRDAGGNYWVLAERLPSHLRLWLEDRGFKEKASKGWYLQ